MENVTVLFMRGLNTDLMQKKRTKNDFFFFLLHKKN